MDSISNLIDIDSLIDFLDKEDVISGRNQLYVPAEVNRNSPITWHHFLPAPEWTKTMSVSTYRIWRQRGFK